MLLGLNPINPLILVKKGPHRRSVLVKTTASKVQYGMRRFQPIVSFVKKNKLVIFIILCAAFVRFFRIGEYAMFLADQGRDAIIIKRIVTLEHFPAIGPPSSIGQVYLGPFFYYLMAPFLFLSRLNPAGLAVGEALIAMAGLIFAYIAIKILLGKKTALIFLVFAAFSFELVRSSRFAWNPNPLPYFAFVTLYFLYKSVTSNKWYYALLFGVFFALCFQLHHLAAFMVVPIFLTFLIAAIRSKKVVSLIVSAFTSLAGFAVTSSPLIIFDLKHGFLNTKNLISLFTKQNLVAGGSPMNRFLDTNRAFLSFVTQMQIGPNTAFFIAFGLMVLIVLLLARQKNISFFVIIHLLNVVSFIYLFSLLSSSRYPHYYGVAYLSFFVLAAYILGSLFRKRYGFIIYIILAGFLILSVPRYDFLSGSPGNQMQHARTIANSVIPHIDNKPFNFATYPIEFTSEDTYLYYLEIAGHTAADRAAHEVAGQMVVLCDRGACDILHTRSWNIDMFGPAKIDTMWSVEGIKAFHLIHAKNL